MPSFAQQTRLVAAPGKADQLVAKFLDAARIQADNDACLLMLVAKSGTEDDVVYVTEVWSSEAAWKTARKSTAVTAWSRDIPKLVAVWPASTPLVDVRGKGIS